MACTYHVGMESIFDRLILTLQPLLPAVLCAEMNISDVNRWRTLWNALSQPGQIGHFVGTVER